MALLASGCSGGAGIADGAPHEPPFEIAIVGGTLIDGTGAAPRRADLGIRGGKIAKLGSLTDAEKDASSRILDAAGLVVAPGFVDLHSHADAILLADAPTRDRLLQAKLRQGITAIVTGNCGLGPAPSDAESAELLRGVNAWMTPEGVAPPAMKFGEYLRAVGDSPLPLHVGGLVPHGPIRILAMGLRPGAATDAELARMREEIVAALDEGAFGLSVGLIYPPGMFSPTEELLTLAQPVAARDRLFAAHIRGSSELLLPATRELIEIGRASGARVHHSHLEAVGRSHWRSIEEILNLEDAARADGVRISHDFFPYSRAATMMAAIFPPWSLEGGVPRLLERLRDPRLRERMREEMEREKAAWPPWVDGGWPHNLVGAVGWDGIRIASVPAEDDRDSIVGLSLERLAALRGTTPFDAVADLMLATDGQVGQWVDEISGQGEERGGLRTILAHAAGAVVTDAEDFGRGAPHPAHAGAFARALRWNREWGEVSLQALIHRMTGYPAELLGLERRGTIAEGMYADLSLFDPAEVADTADWKNPRAVATGFRWVLVNGEIAVDPEGRTEVLAGQLLRAGDS